MPSNLPFKPLYLIKYIEKLNDTRLSKAEVALCQATENQLTGTINPMPGAENQHVQIMQVKAGQAHFLTLQTRMLAMQHPDTPVKALDIGTFTGSSAGALAKGMTYGGKVVTCDISHDYTAIAREYWRQEGIENRIQHIIAPASETARMLLNTPEEKGAYDIVFIDADKTGYDLYYENALELLRPGGLIILDNMLWSGRVADPALHDANTDALRALNDKIAGDKRVASVLLDSDDGTMMAMKN